MAAAVGELVNEPDALTIPITIGAINDPPLMDAVSATPTEPAAPAANVTVTDTTISGNTANQEGGGIWNITAEEEHQEAALLLPAVQAARGDGTNNGQNYVFLSLGHGIDGIPDAEANDATDAFFSEVGSGDSEGTDMDPFSYNYGKIEIVY
jgi:hypothetical protein